MLRVGSRVMRNGLRCGTLRDASCDTLSDTMKRVAAPFALLFLFAGPLAAEAVEEQLLKNYSGPSGLALAVLPPVAEAGAGKVSSDLQARQGRMLERVSRDARFRLVERENLDQVLKEQNLQQSGLVSVESAKVIGQLAAADLVLTIRRTQAGVEYRILDVASAQIFAYALDRPRGTQGDAQLTPRLLAAVLEGDAGQVANLLAEGADPEGRRSDGLPMVFLAIMKDRPDLVQLLLDAGAKTEMADPANSRIRIPYILVAAMQGNVQTARIILKRDPRVVFDRKTVDPSERASVDAKVSALENAGESGLLEMFRLLSDYGAPTNARSLANAASAFTRHFIRGKKTNPPGWENFKLRRADRQEFTAYIEALLDRNRYVSCADENKPSDAGDAFIELAATLTPGFLKRMPSIALFSCAGVRSSSPYRKGNTALHEVLSTLQSLPDVPADVRGNAHAVLQLLLENGADPNRQNTEGEDAVQAGITLDGANLDSVLFMLDHAGVDYACRPDAKGKTALDRARDYSRFEEARFAPVIKRLGAACHK